MDSNIETPDGQSSQKKNGTVKQSEKSGYISKDGYYVRPKGISWIMCAIYLVGDMAGGGIVTISAAFKNTYFYPGIVINFFICLIAAYTSVLLGRCWTILTQRFPQYRTHCRQAYADIGDQAMGKWMKRLVLLTIAVNQFGVSVLYLLLSAKSIADAMYSLGAVELVRGGFDLCALTIILAFILLPILMLKSPADFWWAMIATMCASFLAVFFIILGSALDFKDCHYSERIGTPSVVMIFAALGNMMFTYGGHSGFTTIQHEMSFVKDFDKASALAFCIILILYFPLALIANLTYGDYLGASIINSIRIKWIQITVNLLMAFHCLSAFTLVLNPLNQQVEEYFSAPHEFGITRVFLRTAVAACILMTGLTIVNFGALLDLVGATSTLASVLLYPPLFYFYLNASGNIRDEKMLAAGKQIKKNSNSETTAEFPYEIPTFRQVLQYNSKLSLIVGFSVMAFGVFICICSTIAAIFELTVTDFVPPCYVLWIRPDWKPDNHGIALTCCRKDMDVSSPLHDTCKAPKYGYNLSNFRFFDRE